MYGLHYAASAGDAERFALAAQHKVLTADNQGFTAIEYAFESRRTVYIHVADADERQRFATEKNKNNIPEARAVDVAQQGDWIEYIDHMSRHTYYHNKKTKTRWEKPHGFGMSFVGASQEMTGHSITDKKKRRKRQRRKRKRKRRRKKKKKKKKVRDKDSNKSDSNNESENLKRLKMRRHNQ